MDTQPQKRPRGRPKKTKPSEPEPPKPLVEDIKSLMEKMKPTITATSLAQYERIYKLLDLKTLNDLDNVDRVKDFVANKSENTAKNYYSAIVKILRLAGTKPELLTQYVDLMQEKAKATMPTNKYNEKQKANLMSLKAIETIRDGLLKGINSYTNRLGYDIFLDYLILSLYTMQAPRRNEFFNMKITDDINKVNEKDNYLVWSPRRKAFIYQDYKTAKYYGREIQDINPQLQAVLKTYLKVRESIASPDNDAFLVKWGNQPFESGQEITRRLNRVLGKRIGASMLRHIYLTERYGKTIKLMEADAQAMGHNLDQQRDYIKQ